MTINERDQLVLTYLPLANKLAWAKTRKTPFCVHFEELKSAAYLGLVDAASKFDEEQGVAFSTYARWRIWGGMTDYLRELGWGKDWTAPVADNKWLDDLEAKEDTSRNTEESFEDLIKYLNAIGKRILRWYYVENRSMKEIGQLEGVSEARISQIISRSKAEIRKRLQNHELLQTSA